MLLFIYHDCVFIIEEINAHDLPTRTMSFKIKLSMYSLVDRPDKPAFHFNSSLTNSNIIPFSINDATLVSVWRASWFN